MNESLTMSELVESFELHEAMDFPMVEYLCENGIYPEEAKRITVERLEKNPYLMMHNFPITEETSYDSEESNLLFECFINACIDTRANEKLMMEAFLFNQYKVPVTEGIVDTIADTQAGRFVRRTANTVKQTINPIGQQLMNAVDNIAKWDAEKDREMVLSDNIILKLRHLFKKILTYAVAKPFIFALIPGGFCGLLLKIVMGVVLFFKKWSDILLTAKGVVVGHGGDLAPRAKQKLIQELELELKMTREKIDDAKAAGDKKAKYELMRVENKIEMELGRVKYGARW